MKALSIHQPWAWAILHAGKNVENRTWRTRHRGPLLIHAAKSRTSLDAQDPMHWRRVYGVELPDRSAIAFGGIVGVVDVIGCERVGQCGEMGSFTRSVWGEVDFYGWVLAKPRPFAAPLPYRGMQRLFEVCDESVNHVSVGGVVL